MTPGQRKALAYIAGYIDGHGYPPTVREIMAAMGLHSTSGAVRLVKALVGRKLLSRPEGAYMARNLALTDLGRQQLLTGPAPAVVRP